MGGEGGLIFDSLQAFLRECVTSIPGVFVECMGMMPGPMGKFLGPMASLFNICIDPLVGILGGAICF
jgi:hypothetical protein